MPTIRDVEDNDDNVCMLGRRLSRRGFTVGVARDARVGLPAAATEPPDLVLVDLPLPEIDGSEATRRLKADPATAAIPVIALPAHAMPGDRERARAAGCDELETKPVELARLLAKIRDRLARGAVRAPVLLVVDDDENNRQTPTHRLRREGCRALHEAVDGVDALERVAAEPVDLVLLDMMMPRLDGTGVLARLKAEPAWCHVPVIVISAATDLERVVRAIELGAEDYLAKPFDRVLLGARIGAALEGKRPRDVERHHLAAVEAERRRADALLHLLLPRLAVAEPKAKDRLEPRRFEPVAVPFADIAGFTRWCEAAPPERVVGALDALVRAFEDLMAPFGLEQIHSTGDAFIATADLLEPHTDPTGARLACARAMAAALAGRMPLGPPGGLPLDGRGASEVFRAPGPGPSRRRGLPLPVRAGSGLFRPP